MRVFLLFITFCTLLLAHQRDLDISYKISYGILGKLGVAKAKIRVDENDNYTISIEAKATGAAKVLSLGKKERYESKGVFKNGIFTPSFYIKQSENYIKSRIDTYTFDYTSNKISKHRIVDRREGDNWVQEEDNSIVEFFAKNDILSLFFNIPHFISDFKEPKSYNLIALGGNGDNGKVDIVVPNKDEKLELVAKNVLKVFIYQKIFSSKDGELLVSLRDDGICDKAILKDVLLFGDIVGEIDE